MYGLRKIKKDGKDDFNDFVWPLEVGAEVEAPDLNPVPECGGLYCLPNAQGNWDLLKGDLWAVLEFDENEMVQIDSEKCKVRKCKIVFLSENPNGMLKFFDYENFNLKTYYSWILNVGDQWVIANGMLNILEEMFTEEHENG